MRNFLKGKMIHETAIIDSNAKIENNVEIGPYCVIGSGVHLGKIINYIPT